jgi:hypothetical protein
MTREFIIDLKTYINEIKLILDETIYYIQIKENRRSNNYLVEFFDVNNAFLYSEQIADGEAVFDKLNILNLNSILGYALSNGVLRLVYDPT